MDNIEYYVYTQARKEILKGIPIDILFVDDVNKTCHTLRNVRHPLQVLQHAMEYKMHLTNFFTSNLDHECVITYIPYNDTLQNNLNVE